MAEAILDITGCFNMPSNTGNNFFEPLPIKATNDIFNNLNIIFNDTAAKERVDGKWTVPKDFVSGATIRFVWTSTAIAGNAVFDIDYSCIGGNDAESLDPAAVQRNATGTDAAPGTTMYRLIKDIAMTDADLAVDDTVYMGVSRDGADQSDTIAAAVILTQVLFVYQDA